MNVIWSWEAESDLDDLTHRIARDNPEAAVKMDTLFRSRARELGTFPNLGKVGRVSGTRELVIHKNYSIVYKVHNDFVEIVTLLPSAKNYP